MKSISDKYYTTSYLLLAVTLSFNFPLFDLDKSNPNEIQFLFEHSKELDKMVEAFWRKELRFEPVAFEDQRRSLLRRINESGR